MAIKGKLRLAIAKERAPNFEALKQQRKLKAAVKRKRSRVEQAALHTLPDNKRPINFPTTEEADGDRDCSDEGSEGDRKSLQINLDNVNDSDTSESSMELESKAIEAAEKGRDPLTAVSHAEGEEADDINDIPVSELEDLDDDIKEDLIPHTRLTINNTSAIQAALDRISMPTDGSVSFASHQSIVSPTNTADSIPDVCDDLQRELAFYSQCLDAARQGRLRLLDEQIPFSRPKDYFAEMVKEDAHMEKVKAKLVEEASTKKAIAEARKLRDLKKFGKQVQVAKLQERQKAKRETLEKIKTLKRKRQESSGDLADYEADVFDVAVDDEIKKHSQRSHGGRDLANRPSRPLSSKRQKKDEKYGFGGKKRHTKSGDAISAGNLSAFNPRKMKAGGSRAKTSKPSRPGKARRKVMAAR